MDLVVVDWVDSRQPVSSWQFLEDLEDQPAVICRSVGWLLKDTDVMVLAPNLGDIGASTQVSGVITIPVQCVKKVRRIEIPPTSCPVPSSRPETGQTPPSSGSERQWAS